MNFFGSFLHKGLTNPKGIGITLDQSDTQSNEHTKNLTTVCFKLASTTKTVN